MIEINIKPVKILFEGSVVEVSKVAFTKPDGTIQTFIPERTAKVIDTGCATAWCSECGVEFMGSIMTNEPPDYVKALERCPRCGAIFEDRTEDSEVDE